MNHHASSNSRLVAHSNGPKKSVVRLSSPLARQAIAASSNKRGTAQPKKRKPRNNWTPGEDAALMQIIEGHKFDETQKNHWAQIAQKLRGNRTGKQCRDRWQNHLRPDIKKGQWTKEEEQLIREMHGSFGTKWSCMSKLMKDRTDNDIKNKWYSMMRKEKKASKQNGQIAMQIPALLETQIPVLDQPAEETSFGLVHFGDVESECIYDNITYQDLVPQVNETHLVSLSNYAPQEFPYNWQLGNPYAVPPATYINPPPIRADPGRFALLSDHAQGAQGSAGMVTASESIFQSRANVYGSGHNATPSQVHFAATTTVWGSGLNEMRAPGTNAKTNMDVDDNLKMPPPKGVLVSSHSNALKDCAIPQKCVSTPMETAQTAPLPHGRGPVGASPKEV